MLAEADAGKGLAILEEIKESGLFRAGTKAKVWMPAENNPDKLGFWLVAKETQL